jgi:hypothetical protein
VASGSPEPFITWIREDGREIRINRNSSGSSINIIVGSRISRNTSGSRINRRSSSSRFNRNT